MSEKCQPDDPRRCQGVTPNGQCQYISVEGSNRCNFHSGPSKGTFQQKRVERYLIDNEHLKESYTRHNDDKGYLDLRDDIALVHAMIERRMNLIKTDADLSMAVGPFNVLVSRLESMKISLMKLQQQLGLVIGKDELRHLASSIATILDEELEGMENKEAKLDTILERIFIAVEDAGTKKDQD